MFAQVILPLNVKGTFTYSIPETMRQEMIPGMRVLVPFGGKKIYTGIILQLSQNVPENFVAKEIISILDDVPAISAVQLQFWQWMSDYYLCNLGEIYRLAVPASLKLESETYLRLRPNASIDYDLLDANETFLIQALEVRQLVNLLDIESFIPKKEVVKTINSLFDLQYIEIDEKIAEKYRAKEVKYLQIPDGIYRDGELPNILENLKRSPRQHALFLHILGLVSSDQPAIKKSDAFAETNFTTAQLNALIAKGYLQEFAKTSGRVHQYSGELESMDALSSEQTIAVAEIEHFFSESKPALLHGVTASGKTHVYLELLDRVVQAGRSVLVLLPEVSIAKQITSRLDKKYGQILSVYHPKLNDFERVEIWKKIKANDLKIIIGTRNALFLPFSNLSLIIVDEEHDSAYRPREVSPYFNGRDAALMLAQLSKSKALLCSATPSTETFYNAQNQIFGYVYLEKRFGNTCLPKYELLNFRTELDAKNVTGNFTQYSVQQMGEQLDEKKQVMVLHNRRGYASVVECENCGYVSYCPNCDVVMVYHKATNELKCHYCASKAAKLSVCPKCASAKMNERGVGVEQIAEEVGKLFPAAAVDRMDVDSMRKKYAYEKLFEKMESGETDILVGTQMISKGLDFDRVDLVVVPRADQILHVQDFRAEERVYQLLTQIAGRTGRKTGNGRTLIQTYMPEHPVYQLISQSAPSDIYQYFLTERKKFHYPPFTKLILIELKHRKADKVERAAKFLDSILRKYLPEPCILGPSKAPIARLHTYYQYQILLKLPKGNKYRAYKNLLRTSLDEFREVTAYHSIKTAIFVDY